MTLNKFFGDIHNHVDQPQRRPELRRRVLVPFGDRIEQQNDQARGANHPAAKRAFVEQRDPRLIHRQQGDRPAQDAAAALITVVQDLQHDRRTSHVRRRLSSMGRRPHGPPIFRQASAERAPRPHVSPTPRCRRNSMRAWAVCPSRRYCRSRSRAGLPRLRICALVAGCFLVPGLVPIPPSAPARLTVLSAVGAEPSA